MSISITLNIIAAHWIWTNKQSSVVSLREIKKERELVERITSEVLFKLEMKEIHEREFNQSE